MSEPTFTLITAIRNTISKLESDSPYQWGHMGSCNCGHLAQQITNLSQAQIHEYAMQRMGDWNEQVMEYCPESGLPIDTIIDAMLSAGLSLEDIKQLEKLSNPIILDRIPENNLPLSQNNRRDVIHYFKAWLKILEEQWAENIPFNSPGKTSKRENVLM